MLLINLFILERRRRENGKRSIKTSKVRRKKEEKRVISNLKSFWRGC
jgi:hypothetical protein